MCKKHRQLQSCQLEVARQIELYTGLHHLPNENTYIISKVLCR